MDTNDSNNDNTKADERTIGQSVANKYKIQKIIAIKATNVAKRLINCGRVPPKDATTHTSRMHRNGKIENRNRTIFTSQLQYTRTHKTAETMDFVNYTHIAYGQQQQQ